MSKNKRNKRQSLEPQNQLSSPSPNPPAQQLRQLVEERLNQERINREKHIKWLSTKFQSNEKFIEHIMLLMLVAEKLYIPPSSQYEWFGLEDFLEAYTPVFANKQFAASLLTDTSLIGHLLANDELIDKVFEYLFNQLSDPIKLDVRLISDILISA